MKATRDASLFVIGKTVLYDLEFFWHTGCDQFGLVKLFLKIAALIADVGYVKDKQAGNLCLMSGHLSCCWHG